MAVDRTDRMERLVMEGTADLDSQVVRPEVLVMSGASLREFMIIMPTATASGIKLAMAPLEVVVRMAVIVPTGATVRPAVTVPRWAMDRVVDSLVRIEVHRLVL